MSLFFSERNVFGMSIYVFLSSIPLRFYKHFSLETKMKFLLKALHIVWKLSKLSHMRLLRVIFPLCLSVLLPAMYEFLPRSDDINQRFMTWHHPIFFSETEVWKSMTREEKAASPIDGGSRSISWKSSKKAAILRYGRLLLFDPLFKRILNVKGIFFHWLKTGGTITQTHRLKGTKRYQKVRKGTQLFKMV